MFIAVDHNDKRVHIDDTHSNQEYFCPYCGAPLNTRKGDVRRHHFAHKKSRKCTDGWVYKKGYYDISPWHDDWQNMFPKDNQEIKVTLGNTTHRADIMVGRTVVEFQHSPMQTQSFDDRNNFYLNLGYKIIWLFDMSELIDDERLTYSKSGKRLHFEWQNPKKAFNQYDIKYGNVDIFFQLNDDYKSIVKVTDVSELGFEEFESTDFMSKDDCLEYVGLIDGKCPEPDRMDKDSDKEYLNFKKQYNINLNKQQERALLAVDGSVLLLSVPGSGKTSVLIARLGYMVKVKNIPPENILALSFNINAKDEMKSRFSQKFGSHEADKLEFRTINGFANKIYSDYCDMVHHPKRKLDLPKINSLVREILQVVKKTKYISKDDVDEYKNYISYIKNMEMIPSEIELLDEYVPFMSKVYEMYQSELYRLKLMDFDDQMLFALYILNNKTEYLKSLQKKYNYICVDEAQDTSKIQHEIIELLAETNNIFMVGDEDQSIYGFRGAFPKALLNFKYTYRNTYVVKMEKNYRSKTEIVDIAHKFISQNKGRYEKNMEAALDGNGEVLLCEVENREEQFNFLTDEAAKRTSQTAFLYRENNTAVILVDSFLRKDIPFTLKKPEKNFFHNNAVSKIIKELKNSIADKTFDLEGTSFQCLKDAIEKAKVKNVNDRIEILLNLATKEPVLRDFIKRIDSLTEIFDNGKLSEEKNPVVLSTIHTSKGLEYDTVYLVDIYKGNLPSTKPNPMLMSKDSSCADQEERRIFYVGMTRAKNKLVFIHIKDKESPFLKELFNCTSKEEDEARLKAEEERKRIAAEWERKRRETEEKRQKAIADWERRRFLHPFAMENFPEPPVSKVDEDCNAESSKVSANESLSDSRREAAIKRFNTEIEESDKLKKKRIAVSEENCYCEIADKFTQENEQILDHTGRRWIKCEICHKIKPIDKFSVYGGNNQVNSGKCSECMSKLHANSKENN